MFIAFDGVDGAGKTTQIAALRDRLENELGMEVMTVRDPGGTRVGEAIRALLLDSDLEMHRRCEALLYMASRAQLCEEQIRPALAAGKVVISDRFLLANVVYQSVQGGEDAETIWKLGEIATGGLRPDFTILLDLPVEVGLQRLNRPADRMESRGVEYLEAVRTGFLQHVARVGDHTVIDAGQESERVLKTVWEMVAEKFKMQLAGTGRSE